MKQGTYNHLRVTFDGLDLTEVSQIDFVFTQTKEGPILKECSYLGNPATPEDVELDNGVFKIPFSREDTYLFKPGTAFYMDTRIYPLGNFATGDNPWTPIVLLRMDPTLFDRVDNAEEVTS